MKEATASNAGLVRRAAGQLAPIFDENASGSARAAAAGKATVGVAGLLGGSVAGVDGISFLGHNPVIADALHAAMPYLTLGGLETALPAVGALVVLPAFCDAAETKTSRAAMATFCRRATVAGLVITGGVAMAAAGTDLLGAGSVAHGFAEATTMLGGVTAGAAVSARIWRIGQPRPAQARAQLGE